MLEIDFLRYVKFHLASSLRDSRDFYVIHARCTLKRGKFKGKGCHRSGTVPVDVHDVLQTMNVIEI